MFTIFSQQVFKVLFGANVVRIRMVDFDLRFRVIDMSLLVPEERNAASDL